MNLLQQVKADIRVFMLGIRKGHTNIKPGLFGKMKKKALKICQLFDINRFTLKVT